MSDICYLGITLSIDGEVLKGSNIGIGKATSAALIKLENFWKASKIPNKTKIRIYKSKVRVVLLYGAETWRINKEKERKLKEKKDFKDILRIKFTEYLTLNSQNELVVHQRGNREKEMDIYSICA